MKRVGIFSGTFDPIHIGHIEACLVALAACDLEQVAVLIEKQPHRKRVVTPYAQRKAMVELALADFESISLVDINQSNLTYKKTLPALRRLYPKRQFHLIIGSDMLEHVDAWQDVDKLLQQVKLCVVLRENKDKPETEKILKAFTKVVPGLQYVILPAVWSPISSSAIKKEIAIYGHSDMVHRNVVAYIAKNKLYNTG